jgi:glycosyltransferase 2 family protein
VTSPRPSPPPDDPARPSTATAAGPQPLLVEDHLARRIRKPMDLMRCLVSCIEIVLLAAVAVAAGAATAGIETDVVGASRRLPHALLTVARPVALFALLLLPVALAVRELMRRQPRRLAEAAGTAVLAVAAIAVANALLSHHTSSLLYQAITVSGSATSHAAPLDGYLAGLAAYTTMIGLSGQTRWQGAVWGTFVLYAVVNLAALQTTLLALLIAPLTGRAIGLAVRYAAGTMSQRPAADRIAAALGGAGCQLLEIRRVPPVGHESRRYAATARRGDRLDVCVYDRDQEAAGAIYRLYRAARLEDQVSHSAPLSVDRMTERRALLSYATEEAGVLTPRLQALVRVGPEAMALAFQHHDGTTLDKRDPAPADAELGRVWDAVLRLHAHRVTHRALVSDRILLTGDGQVMLLDPGNGDVAAGDLQLRLDVAQLITELALRVGPDRSVDLALDKLGASELVAVVPLLQPIVLYPSTRAAIRHRKDVLPAMRKRLLEAAPGDEVPPVRLERIRPRTLLTLVASVVAVYLLAGELARASLGSALRSADWRWGLVALALSAVTYVGAALSLSGFVAERLSFVRTILAQLAGSFVTLVTPAAVGGVALNIRYLQRRKVPSAVAAASVAVSQVVAFVLHILLLVLFAALAGTSEGHSIRPPTWVYFVLAGLVVIALVVLAIPAGRRMLRARLAPTFSQVAPRLLEVAQQPRKLAEGVGGALLLTFGYIACLDVCIRALGGSAPFASVAVVYLTGSALGSIVPTPGGLGAVEAALTAGLRAAGVAGGVAVSAVLLFRLLTFWLPVPAGWAALKYLERQQAL